MRLVFLWLFSMPAVAGLSLQGNRVAPFKSDAYPLRSLVKDYAEILQTPVVYDDETISAKSSVQLQINQGMGLVDFKQAISQLLSHQGLSLQEEAGFILITPARDNRYLAGPVFTDESYPRDAGHKMILYTLKHPLAPSITQNLRPYVSRYARVINFSDAHTIIISDMGINAERLIKNIQAMDTDEAYQRFLAQKPKEKKENTEEQEKILTLELENKLLEKKYLELKEAQAAGAHP